MALDPNISLGIQPVTIDAASAMQKGMTLRNLSYQPALYEQQLASGRASQLATEQATRNAAAQTPGIVAQSTSAEQQAKAAVQDQEARQRAIDLANSGKYTTTAPDGTNSLNYPKLFGDLAQSHPQQALALAGQTYDTEYKNQQAQAAQTGTQAGMQKFANDVIQAGANVIEKSSMSPEQKAEAMQNMIERQAAHYPQAFEGSPYVIKDDQGKPMVTPLGKSDVKKLAEGQFGQLAERQMALSEYTSSPDYINKLAMNSADINPAMSKIEAQKQVGVASAYNADLMQGIRVAEQVNSMLGDTRLGAALTESITRNLQGPNSAVLASFQKSVDAYNTVHPDAPLDIAKLGVRAVTQKLQAEANRNQQSINVYKGLAGSARVSEAVPKTEGSVEGSQVTKKAPQTAIDHLKSHPELSSKFKEKYGYLP